MSNSDINMSIVDAARSAGIELQKIKVTDPHGRFPAHIGGFTYCKNQLAKLEKFSDIRTAELQAKLDAVMMEHCPGEMTQEQIYRWAAHQSRVVKPLISTKGIFMGGAVAISIRRENGEVIKMCRQTGSEGYVFLNQNFLKGDYDQAINDYLVTWNMMREDYLAQQAGKPAEHLMSDFYAPHTFLAPAGYGLNIIDFKTKIIRCIQDYNTPGQFSHFDLISGSESEDELPVWLALALSDSKFVYNRRAASAERYTFSEYFGSSDIHHAINACKLNLNRGQAAARSYMEKAKLDLSCKFLSSDDLVVSFDIAALANLKTISYEKTYTGYKQMLGDLVADGFVLESDELDVWVSYVEDLANDETDITADEIKLELTAIASKKPGTAIRP